MPLERDPATLLDLVIAGQRIQELIAGQSFAEFSADLKTQSAASSGIPPLHRQERASPDGLGLDDREHPIEPLALTLQSLQHPGRLLRTTQSRQADEDDPSGRPLLEKGELGEVLVVRQQDTILGQGPGQDLGIGCPGLVGGRGDVLTAFPKPLDDGELQVLVGQEPHRPI